MGAEAEHVLQTAVWLFRAFVSGVAGKDVSERRMTRETADAWKAHTVADFEKCLREAAPLPREADRR